MPTPDFLTPSRDITLGPGDISGIVNTGVLNISSGLSVQDLQLIANQLRPIFQALTARISELETSLAQVRARQEAWFQTDSQNLELEEAILIPSTNDLPPSPANNALEQLRKVITNGQ